MPSETSKKRIEALAGDIRRHRDLYYNAEPEISDEEFDALVDRLTALDPSHPVLAEVGAPVPSAPPPAATAQSPHEDGQAEELIAMADRFYSGWRPSTTDERRYKTLWLAVKEQTPDHDAFIDAPAPKGADWPKARHDIPMGSLNKATNVEELQAWATRCDELAAKAGAGEISTDLAVTEKLDGISLEMVYENGKLIAGITRGDGHLGEQITPNVKRMQGVPHTVDNPGRVSVRGEIVLRKSDTERMTALKTELDPNFDPEISLRNTAAGAARAKNPKFLPATKLLTVLTYDLEGVEGIGEEKKKLECLKRLGFQTPSMGFFDLDATAAHYREYQDTLRKGLDYDIDGLVIRANQVSAFAALGDLNNRPRAAIALKFGNEMAVSTVRDIFWETGSTGRVTPVAVIDPVRLVGAEVRRVSLHNVARVRALGIGIGDEVLVSRRNDVIPYVEKVEISGPENEAPPSHCAVCAAKLEMDGEYLSCRSANCQARRLGRLKIWIRELGLLDWGDKTLETLYELGIIEEPADLYRLTPERLTAVEGFAEIRAQKLLEPLADKKTLPIATFIAALGIETVSKETAKRLVEAGLETPRAIAETTVEDLAAIPGLGEIKAEKIISGMTSRLEEIQRLESVGVIPVVPDDAGPLAGISFCFSGSHSRPRKVLQNIVDHNGGKVSSGVTKGLNYLVLADPSSTSSKAQKARNLGTAVVGEDEFDAIVAERGGNLDA